VDRATTDCIANLDDMGYFKNDDERSFTKEFLTSVMERAGMTEGEVQRMEKIFSKANKIAKHKEA
jgi:tRNA/rRNA methyltransferase